MTHSSFWIWYIIALIIVITILLIWLQNKNTKKTCVSCIVSNLDAQIPTQISDPECNLTGVEFFSLYLTGSADDSAGVDNRYLAVIDTNDGTLQDPRYQPAFLSNTVYSLDIATTGQIIVGVSGPYNPNAAVANPLNLVQGSTYSTIYKMNSNLEIDLTFGSPSNMIPPLQELPTIGYIFIEQQNWQIVQVVSLGDGTILAAFDDGTNTQLLGKFLSDGYDPANLPSGFDSTFGTAGIVNSETGTIRSMLVTDNGQIIVGGEDTSGNTYILSSYNSDGTFVDTEATQFTYTSGVNTVSNITSLAAWGDVIYASGLVVSSTVPGILQPATTSRVLNSSGVFQANADYTTAEIFIFNGATNYNTPQIIRQTTGNLVVNTFLDTDTRVFFYGLLNNGTVNSDFGTAGVVQNTIDASFDILSTTLSLSQSNGVIASGKMTSVSPATEYWILGYNSTGKTLLNQQRGTNQQNVPVDPSVTQEIAEISSAVYNNGKYVVGGASTMPDRTYSDTGEADLATTQGLAMTFSCR